MGQAAHAGTGLLQIDPRTPGPTYPEMKVLPAAEGLAVALKGLHHQALTGPSRGRPEAQHTGLRLEDPLSELKHRGRCARLTLQGEGRFCVDLLLICGRGEQRTGSVRCTCASLSLLGCSPAPASSL